MTIRPYANHSILTRAEADAQIASKAPKAERAQATYLRAFTGDQLITASNTLEAAAREYPKSELQADCARTIATTVNGEKLAMPVVATGWITRACALGLPSKGAKRAADQEAYMQGALAMAVALGVMSQDRANFVAFLTAAGRLDGYVQGMASQDVSAR